ncbi:methenyltetrahydrofolate cyclohydrolase [Clostridium carboxidivorans P7]|uniref:Bifunctional protein FolD n=1 Tax=Clostridium carboxidivorans P7 TaxID=536227 RepID=C6PVW9_9CLOT|nr:tetrahydrofolate dehydrogenase/cyclohydrolase catalytic domain-containing protein [Clostridium carboxidivorans]ADO12099.1 bifunctional methylenetetrahydrofolate dehydrogenase (NADP+)/methenyltetrahydrofolate cyclohydrolase [Clostridium carboxidivorans P7]AKN32784.1 methenyltetrahydrofolate cyclohydrolase [Clostridium carboxidivorans P7]EET86600.1 Methylenetetrahydrofolate dehydrogenase (NADP(+)) [Clostridium carboxidivorans P7]EFG89977.1 tetrahydrofolate dehydrogenase/cyclohydrolase, NAD(P)-
MGQIIKGKPVADAISTVLTKEVEELKAKGITPKLTIVRVGANGSDLAYERGALKRCASIGIDTEVKELPENIEQDDFIAELKKVNEDKATNGILIFRPFPKQLDESVIKYIIAPEKDVDCFSPVNVAKLMEKDETGFAPCTPSAVIEILKHYNVPMKGKNAVVIGRSMVVGKPVSMLLLNENATVTICHSRTQDMPSVTSKADIVIVGIGKAKMIDSKYIGDEAVVIDVGINVDEKGNLCGDADTDSCIEKASMITPVPAGVGSVTTSILAKHVVKACKLQNNLV